MISVQDAIATIENHIQAGETYVKKIDKALHLVLAEDILSPIDMPPFKQSSMDGYAFSHSEEKTYTVVGEVQAGTSKNIKLEKGEAVRIFTGARVPDAADTVVMQEHTTIAKNLLHIQQLPASGANVRPQGEQIQKEGVALQKGTVLNEAAIGFLVGLGIEKVKVFKRPSVSILITGNELKMRGELLEPGQVYESNSITLQLALQRIGIKKVNIERVKDQLEPTVKTIKKHLKQSDVVLVSGGISVGDYDFVKEALIRNNVKELFYKVNQKPGKPLWFGKKGEKVIFALPGNPASSLTCCYVYVLPALKKMMGHSDIHLPRKTASASYEIRNKHGKDLFLKGIVHQGNAEVLTGQASSMLKSFAICNALLLVPSDVETISKDETLHYIALK